MKTFSNLVLPIVLIGLVVIVFVLYLIDIWTKVENLYMISGAVCLSLLFGIIIIFMIIVTHEGYQDCK